MTAVYGGDLSERFNQDGGLLKTVAMATMLVDHIGVVFFPGVLELRFIGRIAFPLFCWGIVMGFCYTSSWPKYALRLAIGFVVAQPFYMLALRHSLLEFNVMATLLLGLLSLVGMREKRWYSHIWAPLLCLILAAAQRMDYGWKGVLLIQLMYLCRQSPGGLAAMMVAFCLYWGGDSGHISHLFGYPIRPQLASAAGQLTISMLFSFLRLQTLALLSLPFILCQTASGIRVSKWLGYAMYPGHLLLLWLIRQVA